MKIVKKYQGTIPSNKIVSTKIDSDTDTYSCNFINGIVLYEAPLQSIGGYSFDVNNLSQYRYFDVIHGGDNTTASYRHVVRGIYGGTIMLYFQSGGSQTTNYTREVSFGVNGNNTISFSRGMQPGAAWRDEACVILKIIAYK